MIFKTYNESINQFIGMTLSNESETIVRQLFTEHETEDFEPTMLAVLREGIEIGLIAEYFPMSQPIIIGENVTLTKDLEFLPLSGNPI